MCPEGGEASHALRNGVVMGVDGRIDEDPVLAGENEVIAESAESHGDQSLSSIDNRSFELSEEVDEEAEGAKVYHVVPDLLESCFEDHLFFSGGGLVDIGHGLYQKVVGAGEHQEVL